MLESTQPGRSTASYRWLVLALAAVFLFIHLSLFPYAFDDAYIHIRVAQNLLESGKPYFNPNEALKVSSSSGWSIFLAMILAPMRFLGIEDRLPMTLGIINSGFSIAGVLIFTKVISAVLDRDLTTVEKFFFQVPCLGLLAVSSIGMMETPLAMLWMALGTFRLLKSDRVGFILLGIAVYCRIELVIPAFLLTLLFVHRDKVPLWIAALLSLAGMLPFLIYDFLFFRTVVPHSMVAKSIVYSISELHAFTRLIRLSFPGHILNNEPLTFSLGLIAMLGMLVAIASSVIRNWQLDRAVFVLAFIAWGLSLILGYVARRVLLFEWYTPLFTVPMFLALTVSAYQPRSSKWRFPLLMQRTVAIIYIAGLGQVFFAAAQNPGLYEQFEAGSRVRSYISVGRILDAAFPNATLLSSEIGGLGYGFTGYVADAAGLASQDALAFHPMPIPEARVRGDLGAIPPGYVERIMPDLIVSYDHFAVALLSDEVRGQYQTVLVPAYTAEDLRYARSQTLWGNVFLRIYIRKGLAIPDQLHRLEAD